MFSANNFLKSTQRARLAFRPITPSQKKTLKKMGYDETRIPASADKASALIEKSITQSKALNREQLYVQRAFDKEIRNLTGLHKGSRHPALRASALKLHSLAKSTPYLSAQEVDDAIMAAARSLGSIQQYGEKCYERLLDGAREKSTPRPDWPDFTQDHKPLTRKVVPQNKPKSLKPPTTTAIATVVKEREPVAAPVPTVTQSEAKRLKPIAYEEPREFNMWRCYEELSRIASETYDFDLIDKADEAILWDDEWELMELVEQAQNANHQRALL